MTTCNCRAVPTTISRAIRRKLRRRGITPVSVAVHADNCPAANAESLQPWMFVGQPRSEFRRG